VNNKQDCCPQFSLCSLYSILLCTNQTNNLTFQKLICTIRQDRDSSFVCLLYALPLPFPLLLIPVYLSVVIVDSCSTDSHICAQFLDFFCYNWRSFHCGFRGLRSTRYVPIYLDNAYNILVECTSDDMTVWVKCPVCKKMDRFVHTTVARLPTYYDPTGCLSPKFSCVSCESTTYKI